MKKKLLSIIICALCATFLASIFVLHNMAEVFTTSVSALPLEEAHKLFFGFEKTTPTSNDTVPIQSTNNDILFNINLSYSIINLYGLFIIMGIATGLLINAILLKNKKGKKLILNTLVTFVCIVMLYALFIFARYIMISPYVGSPFEDGSIVKLIITSLLEATAITPTFIIAFIITLIANFIFHKKVKKN